ncbi:DUF6344 domain-containing protein [Streptomyces sp. NPDC058964]|uniref:DUF6344 domain-containing protein n=1 Tax=Streptomyces sp. NPDC058964 TaxID=3346681 RepID=UPI0036B99E8B
MARNKVMKLWTTIVTAFLALCTALGLVTANTAAAVPQPEPPRNSNAHPRVPAAPAMPMSHWFWSWAHVRALPPTMKQRIGAEAHGKSPSCRHRPLDDSAESLAPAEPQAPLAC